jgi:protein-S-isoprenylcysteine O-methyltransferase Ste14
VPVISFAAILLAMAVYGLVHSLLASWGAKALVETRLGRPVYRRGYRLFFNLAAVITFLPVLALAAALPDRTIYTIPFPWALLTLAVQGLAALGALYAVWLTGLWNFAGLEQLFDPGAADRPRVLATGGLYRWVRHPIYTCSLLFLWLGPRMSWNMLAFNLGVTLYFVVGALYEERKLVKEFGQTYIDYRRRTPMLVPGWVRRER